jgi:hypothetical protein
MAEAPIPASSTDRACLPCRVTGALTFSGVSAYLLWERSKLPSAAAAAAVADAAGGGARGHRATLAVLSAAFAAAAVVRALG